jgi:hypothetical protein
MDEAGVCEQTRCERLFSSTIRIDPHVIATREEMSDVRSR